MRSSNYWSRRDFVRSAGLATGLMTAGDAGAFALAEPPPDPDAVLARLLGGANVRKCAETIRGLDPILSKAVSSQGLKVVGAVYDLKSGMVDLLT